MVFSSDDEEESNNFETLNSMLNYQPGKVKFQHLVAKPVKSESVYLSDVVIFTAISYCVA